MSLKKIAIITTGQPSTNPRAVKEAISLSEAGYEVTFIYSFWAEWAFRYDKEIISEYPKIVWELTGSNPITGKTKFTISRIKHKGFRLLNKLFPSNNFFAQNAATRNYARLAAAAARTKSDLYIAHNLGALAAAAKAAKKNQSIYAFDAEDFHRGQEQKDSIDQRRAILLENQYLPGASYVSGASPLIAKEYEMLYKKPVVEINNVFSKSNAINHIKATSFPIKLFWFSQTVGKNRGIEDVVMALSEIPENFFELTLLGKQSEEIKNYFTSMGKNGNQQVRIHFLNPVSQEDLFTIAGKCDIGLALETGKDENNGIALSNKIFTYLSGGNAILFSDTKAQKRFYEENKGVGIMYESGNVGELKNILLTLSSNLSMIDEMKRSAIKLADETYHWEKEAEKLLTTIHRLE